jgi:predicted nuclease of predicted toxin-antitoxin system
MKLLLDEHFSRDVKSLLHERGYLTSSIRDHNLGGSKDIVLLRYAEQHQFIFVTNDLKFITLVIRRMEPINTGIISISTYDCTAHKNNYSGQRVADMIDKAAQFSVNCTGPFLTCINDTMLRNFVFQTIQRQN